MNLGVLAGVNANTWKYFVPEMLVASKTGTPTPLAFGTGVATPAGRFIRVGDVVMVQMQVGFGVSPTKGVGDAYLFKLPVPAKRMIPEDSAAPQVIGCGYNYHAITGDAYNQPIIAVLSDNYASNGNDSERYCQFFNGGYAMTYGSTTFSGRSVTTKTIPHNLGFTPRASDIEITFEGTDNNTLQSDQGHYWIDTITSTTFNLNIRNAVDL